MSVDLPIETILQAKALYRKSVYPETEPFDYLWQLIKEHEGVIRTEKYEFGIRKDNFLFKDPHHESVIRLDIRDRKNRDILLESYLLGSTTEHAGVLQMQFGYPSLTGVQEAPTGTPAEMTEDQEKKLAYSRLVRVAQFVDRELQKESEKFEESLRGIVEKK